MNYERRRLVRHRRMRRTALTDQIRYTAATVMDYIPEIVAAIGIAIGVFYLIPILLGAIGTVVGVIP